MPTKFSTDHTWVDFEEDAEATIGITRHAQESLGDVVFVELPAVGSTLSKGEVAGVVESVKAAADVVMPLGGEITEVNEALRENPALANTDPLGSGWLFKVHMTDTAELGPLLDAPAYDVLVKNS